jgi:peroxin-6
MSQAFNDCLADVEARMKSTGNQIFVIATASDTSKVPAVLLSRFTNELVLKVGTLLIAYQTICIIFVIPLTGSE